MAETLSDEHVLLLEKTLQKNNEMIAENQKLREEMKAKEENHNKVQVPSACRVSIPICDSHLPKFWFNRSH